MAEYHFPIPGADNNNDIIVIARRHWVAFLGQFLLSFLLLVIPIIIIIIIFVSDFDTKIFQGIVENFLVLILSAYYLVVITFAFISWISFYYNIYIVTKTEIIEITQTGFFGRKISQLSLLRVQDVTSEIKGILPTFFAYGDVLVETASEQEERICLQSVPNPQEICSKIMELHDKVIEVEGRHHQLLEGEGFLAPGSIEEKKEEEELPSGIGLPEESSEKKTTPEPPKKTSYQELLEKEKKGIEEGEISKDDLEKGGEIDLK